MVAWSRGASVYDGNPIVVTETTHLRARIRFNSERWSDIVETVYVVSVPPIAITEIMYNPEDGSAMEFVELHNAGTERLSLRGAAFIDGIAFEFDEDAIVDSGVHRPRQRPRVLCDSLRRQ